MPDDRTGEHALPLYSSSSRLHTVDLQHLIPKVVDHLHRDLLAPGRLEGVAGGRLQRTPGGFIHLSLELLIQGWSSLERYAYRAKKLTPS